MGGKVPVETIRAVIQGAKPAVIGNERRWLCDVLQTGLTFEELWAAKMEGAVILSTCPNACTRTYGVQADRKREKSATKGPTGQTVYHFVQVDPSWRKTLKQGAWVDVDQD